MLKRVKAQLTAFSESTKNFPFLVGLVSGLYPLLFYYSNNYPRLNSARHLLFFSLYFLFAPIVVTCAGYAIFAATKKLRPYREHLLFVFLIFFTSVFISKAIYMVLKKDILLVALVIAVAASFKLHRHYRRIIILIILMALIPIFKCAVHILEDFRPMGWTTQPDSVVQAKFVHKPNIYFIQPDGYASQAVMENEPYSYKSGIYEWLRQNGFKVYDDFRSNYPGTLSTNASMFAMKQHYFDDFIMPSYEMPNARHMILNNDALRILKNNGYMTFCVTENEFFRQTFEEGLYDDYNVALDDIPLFSFGEADRDTYAGLEKAIAINTDRPKFIFVEKLSPHHAKLRDDPVQVAAQKKKYFRNVEKANTWLKRSLNLIHDNDPDAVVVVLADHGGWVGIGSTANFFSTKDPTLIYSTFGNLAAIKWGSLDYKGYDVNLRTNVNVFRVLFASLSENKSYLDHLEEDASYNIRPDNYFFNSVYKLINGEGNVVYEKHE